MDSVGRRHVPGNGVSRENCLREQTPKSKGTRRQRTEGAAPMTLCGAATGDCRCGLLTKLRLELQAGTWGAFGVLLQSAISGAESLVSYLWQTPVVASPLASWPTELFTNFLFYAHQCFACAGVFVRMSDPSELE